MATDVATIQQRRFYNTNWTRDMGLRLFEITLRKTALKAYINLPNPAWEQLKIIYQDPTPVEVTDEDEDNVGNASTKNANQDVISLSPQSADNSI
ncbi:UNVERIFIED_CONTAM: hypothetical protein Sradi_5817100 [Sesamum radiatum]|uniref:Uncharacterized protein n=1 Tax=Sesamum radiatum TaxID=300843 RepID=A0AAW2KQD1_SESRA